MIRNACWSPGMIAARGDYPSIHGPAVSGPSRSRPAAALRRRRGTHRLSGSVLVIRALTSRADRSRVPFFERLRVWRKTRSELHHVHVILPAVFVSGTSRSRSLPEVGSVARIDARRRRLPRCVTSRRGTVASHRLPCTAPTPTDWVPRSSSSEQSTGSGNFPESAIRTLA